MNRRLNNALQSAASAFWAIANMRVTEETDKAEVLALCMSIAKVELQTIENYLKNGEAKK
jgi:hypothetical protein